MNQMIQLKLWAGIDPDQRKFERLWFMIWIESDAGEPDVSRFKFVWAVHKSASQSIKCQNNLGIPRL